MRANILPSWILVLAAAALDAAEAAALLRDQGAPALRGPLRLRKGEVSDNFAHQARGNHPEERVQDPLPFQSLTEVMAKVRDHIGGFPRKSSIINVGAAYKDVDPIYNMDLRSIYPGGYNLVGYECEHKRIAKLATMRPDVEIREQCVTGPSIVKDMKSLKIEERLSLVKTDIDSVDGPVLDSILRHYKPYVVYSEIMWDFPPPLEFSLVGLTSSNYNPFTGGCFGMSLMMANRILERNGYRLIEAAHANIIAVHESVADLFADRPQDPWFWFQSVKSGLYHSHWLGQGIINASKNSPMALFQDGLGLYKELKRTDGNDNFGKPVVGIRTMDDTMARIASRVVEGCKISGNHKWMLAVGDRCCAPQWGELPGCVCEFP